MAAPPHAASSAADALDRMTPSAARRLSDAGTPVAGRLLCISDRTVCSAASAATVTAPLAATLPFAAVDVRPVWNASRCGRRYSQKSCSFGTIAHPERWRYISGSSTPGGTVPFSRSSLRRRQQAAPHADDHRVGRAERLLAAIDDGALAPGDRAVLDDHAGHARVARHGATGLLLFAVDAEVVVPGLPPCRRRTSDGSGRGSPRCWAAGRAHRRRAAARARRLVEAARWSCPTTCCACRRAAR